MRKLGYSGSIIMIWTLVVLFIATSSILTSQAYGISKSLKEKAMVEFKAANYSLAIEHLKQACKETPEDPEIFYLLGYYKHYLCYDSVPLLGFTRDDSDEVLVYLKKAVELAPDYGNAFYFIGAEYGARARDEMQRGNPKGVVEQFQLGKKAGGFPDWMIEYGRNTLRSCDPDAILFVGGDAGTNPVQYLQSVQKYRTDVTVIPLAALNRPWFVSLLKKGLEDIVKPAPISWSNEQIAKMRPYKWKTNIVHIPIPDDIQLANNLDQSSIEWELKPDLGGGEKLDLLSASRAVFADIVISNKWKRPIYFSTGCQSGIWEGLENHLISCGFTQQLLPFRPGVTIDVENTRSFLLNDNNFKEIPTLRDNDMPRVSYMLGNYQVQYLRLILHYIENDDIESGRAVFSAMKRNVPEDFVPMSEWVKNHTEALEEKFKKLDNE